MRHIGSLALALLVTPLTWVLTAIGLTAYARAGADPGPEVFLGLLALLGAGGLLALLLLPRSSPAGPILAGLLLLAMTAWATADLPALRRVLPDDLFGLDLALASPAGGLAAVLAVPLLATGLSPRRWRGQDRVPAVSAPPPPGSYAPPHPAPGDATVHLPPSPTSGAPGFAPRTGPAAGFTPAPAGFPSPPARFAPAAGDAGRSAPAGTEPASAVPAPANAAPTSGVPAPAGLPPLRPAGRELDTDATARLSPPAVPAFVAPDQPTSDLRKPAQPDAEATMAPGTPSPEPDTAAVAVPFRAPASAADGEATTVLRPPGDEHPTVATPTTGEPAPARPAMTDEVTERIRATERIDEATERIDEVTARLRDTPPPPAAYPPPGHSTPTAPPVDPDVTRRL
ncbi:hypothetical protein [Polymorphospora sp. NPDC050346]|uniref:hypothetical protein n=1 Tax=Polymorphospora sp. NPDC050346 TaxID=3155780 RepID=UPI0033CEB224